MRELMYLSRRKLAQFQLDHRRGSFLRRMTGLGAKLPLALGEFNLSFEASKGDLASLDEVLKELDRRRLRWYGDMNAQVGEWTRFDTYLSQSQVSYEWIEYSQLVLFWTPKGRHDLGPPLILHATQGGLLGRGEVRASGSFYMSELGEFLKELQRIFHSRVELSGLSDERRRWVHSGLDAIVEEMGRADYTHTAERFAGCARITGRIGPYTLATPLYIERMSFHD